MKKTEKLLVISSALDCATSGQFNIKQLKTISKEFLKRLENWHKVTIKPINTSQDIK